VVIKSGGKASANQLRIAVTDHAVVRYLERCLGVDIARIRDYLTPGDKVREALPQFDGKEVRVIKPDCALIVRNDTVITVLKKS
jgi:hypothetical protein